MSTASQKSGFPVMDLPIWRVGFGFTVRRGLIYYPDDEIKDTIILTFWHEDDKDLAVSLDPSWTDEEVWKFAVERYNAHCPARN